MQGALGPSVGCWDLIPGRVRRQVFKAFLGLPSWKVGGRPRLNPWCNRLWLTVAAGSLLRRGVRTNRLIGGPQGQTTLLY